MAQGKRQSKPRVSGRVDINYALPWDLAALPRIGETMAFRIVEERGKGGHFKSWQDFRERVAGIGPRILKRIRPKAKMGPATKGPNPAFVVPHSTQAQREEMNARIREFATNPNPLNLPPGHTISVSLQGHSHACQLVCGSTTPCTIKCHNHHTHTHVLDDCLKGCIFFPITCEVHASTAFCLLRLRSVHFLF